MRVDGCSGHSNRQACLHNSVAAPGVYICGCACTYVRVHMCVYICVYVIEWKWLRLVGATVQQHSVGLESALLVCVLFFLFLFCSCHDSSYIVLIFLSHHSLSSFSSFSSFAITQAASLSLLKLHLSQPLLLLPLLKLHRSRPH